MKYICKSFIYIEDILCWCIRTEDGNYYFLFDENLSLINLLQIISAYESFFSCSSSTYLQN